MDISVQSVASFIDPVITSIVESIPLYWPVQ